MDKKGLDYDGFRSLAVWLMDKIKGLWDEREARYAGAVYLTQAEYDALSEEQKMDATKVYFIVEE
jgi:hypothetical protein